MKLKNALVAGVTAAAVAASGVTAAGAEDKTVLEKGHVDVFYTQLAGDDLQLKLKDETTTKEIVRDPSSVVLKLNEDAWKEASLFDGYENNFINSSGAYIPQTQDPAVLWAGWSPVNYGDEVTFDFKNVTGPGQVYLYKTFGANEEGKIKTSSLFADGQYALKTGSTLTASATHAHANWVFTQPGTYTMTVQATQGDKVSNEATYTWEVAAAEAQSTPKPPTKTQETPQPPAKTEDKGLDTGAIVGIVLAILAVIGGLIGAAASGLIPGLPNLQR